MTAAAAIAAVGLDVGAPAGARRETLETGARRAGAVLTRLAGGAALPAVRRVGARVDAGTAAFRETGRALALSGLAEPPGLARVAALSAVRGVGVCVDAGTAAGERPGGTSARRVRARLRRRAHGAAGATVLRAVGGVRAYAVAVGEARLTIADPGVARAASGTGVPTRTAMGGAAAQIHALGAARRLSGSARRRGGSAGAERRAAFGSSVSTRPGEQEARQEQHQTAESVGHGCEPCGGRSQSKSGRDARSIG